MNKTITYKIFDDACRNESIEILLLSVLVNEQISPAKVVVQVDLNVDEQSQSGLDLLGIGWAEPFSQTARPHSSSPAPQPLFASTEFSAVNADQIKIRSTKNEERGTKTSHFQHTILRILLSTVSALRLILESEVTVLYTSNLEILRPVAPICEPAICKPRRSLACKPLAPQPYLVKFPRASRIQDLGVLPLPAPTIVAATLPTL
jgi:hypothetical protein